MSKKSTQTLELAPNTDLPPAEGRANKREDTRSQIALYYVIGFLVTIILVIGICAVQGVPTSDYKDLLLAVSGVLSGPLGFIIGYYFKSHPNGEVG